MKNGRPLALTLFIFSAMLMCASLHLAGCGKLEKTPVPPPEKDAVKSTVVNDAASGGHLRYYTFTTDRPYRIEFHVKQSDVAAAESLLKNIDRESLENNDGRMFGLNRTDNNFLLRYWECIYHGMYRHNRPAIARLADVFKRIKTEQGLNDKQVIYTIARFVQFMQYYIPPGIGIYSPARVLMEKGKGSGEQPPPGNETGWNGAGDCDTKSLLMVLLLQECGYDAVVLDSYRYHHAMAAVSFPGFDGTSIEFRGKTYMVIESTYPNWNIGQMPQQYTDLSYFLPIDPRENRPAVDRVVTQASPQGAGLTAAQGAGEREPNDTRESADKVTELALDGQLTGEDGEDWFRLGGQESTFASFTIVHDADNDFNFEVFNDMASVAHARGSGSSDTVSCDIPGTCYVRVYRVSGSGPYTVIITPGGSAEKEPNNTAEDAGQVASTSIFGEIENAGDVDFYALAGQEGFNAIYTIFHGADNDFNIEVFNDGVSVGRAVGNRSGDTMTAEHPGRVSLRIWSTRGSGWYLVRINRNR
jgi:hypothetical protein